MSVLKFALALALLAAPALIAQSTLPATPQPASSSSAAVGSWDAVINIPTVTPIRISDFGNHESCVFISADENNLVCDHRSSIFFIPIHNRVTFRRAEVLKVRKSHRIYSGLLGGAIGAGIGILAGLPIDGSSNHSYFLDRHYASYFLGFFGAGIGDSIGRYTDFLASPTIYRRP